MLLRQTPRVVTPFGGLSVLNEFLRKIGYRQQVSEHFPVHRKSPNAIPVEETFTAFLISVVAGARRRSNSSTGSRRCKQQCSSWDLAFLCAPNCRPYECGGRRCRICRLRASVE